MIGTKYKPSYAGHMKIYNWLENSPTVSPDLDIGNILYFTVQGDSNHGYLANAIRNFPYCVKHKYTWGPTETEEWRYDLEPVDAENPIPSVMIIARRDTWRGSAGDVVCVVFRINTGVPKIEYEIIKKDGYDSQGPGPHFNATVVITH